MATLHQYITIDILAPTMMCTAAEASNVATTFQHSPGHEIAHTDISLSLYNIMDVLKSIFYGWFSLSDAAGFDD